ncbi:MAG: menaquinone reductase integral membrane subunit QrcD [Bacteroidota bacterium]|jgi:molybdopterin-containing oxidoreductase family membrane subunit
MDKFLIPRGLQRTTFSHFIAWIIPWFLLLAFGLYAIYLCLAEGLNHTNMDNRFAFGLWIYLDLSVIALGAGAFFTGFLLYIMRRKELKAVINSAVVIGLICYSGAVLVLMVDVGQPLRAWFTFWHPNTHSMLTEVTFCLTCYLTVLIIEYAPIVLKNRKIRQIPKFLVFEFELHKLMPVLAGIGTLLSFFHQGSLGGLFGVLRGRPFAFREELGIWPSTFFLFVLSAAAAGPSFTLLTTWLVQKITKKQLVRPSVLKFLGKVSGSLLIVYILLKSIDTLIWINNTSPNTGFPAFEFYERASFGTWILFTEIVLLGLVPALILLSKRLREKTPLMVTAAVMVCCGIMLNRFVMTIQTLALPTLPFDQFLSYTPSWEEIAAFLFVIAYGVLLYSFTFRYTPMFPQERELNVLQPERIRMEGSRTAASVKGSKIFAWLLNK